ncbi:MAG: hypothetical protein JOY92_04445 [Verrucomicrobia bacterium]|nr:hypothetical protein [Verrucomicrobiota bacterium]
MTAAPALSLSENLGLAALLLAVSGPHFPACVFGVNRVRQKIHLAKIELKLL